MISVHDFIENDAVHGSREDTAEIVGAMLCINARTVWTLAQSSAWWEDVALGTWRSSDWVSHLRITKEMFDTIITDLAPFISTEDTKFRKVIT